MCCQHRKLNACHSWFLMPSPPAISFQAVTPPSHWPLRLKILKSSMTLLYTPHALCQEVVSALPSEDTPSASTVPAVVQVAILCRDCHDVLITDSAPIIASPQPFISQGGPLQTLFRPCQSLLKPSNRSSAPSELKPQGILSQLLTSASIKFGLTHLLMQHRPTCYLWNTAGHTSPWRLPFLGCSLSMSAWHTPSLPSSS